MIFFLNPPPPEGLEILNMKPGGGALNLGGILGIPKHQEAWKLGQTTFFLVRGGGHFLSSKNQLHVFSKAQPGTHPWARNFGCKGEEKWP